MDEKTLTSRGARAIGSHLCEDGEFAGWYSYFDDGFEAHNGPFWYRQESDGSMRAVFRVQKKHVRDTGSIHGGCLATFADTCLQIIAKPVLSGPGVTTNLSCEFIDTAYEGDLVVCTGEVIRAGRTLIFVRGQIKTDDRTLCTFSGTIMRGVRERRDVLEPDTE